MLFWLALIAIICVIKKLLKKQVIPKGFYAVPKVKNKWPIVGNGIDFSKDPIKFMANAHKKYGKIFRMQLFNLDMIVVCDQEMLNEYFSAKEEELSLYSVLERLYFNDAFSDDPAMFPEIINIIKRTVKIRYSEFAPKIMDEAKIMVDRMKKDCLNKHIKIDEEMMRFVSRTSARCFMAIELSNKFYETLIKYTNLINKIIELTYFLPKWILRLFLNSFVKRYRDKMIRELIPLIQSYRDDNNKNDSLVIRTAIDYVNKTTKKKFSNNEVGNILLALLFVTSGNTAVGLANIMTDLARFPEHWNAAREEGKKHTVSGDLQSLFSSEILGSYIYETARTTSHILSINRKPKNKKTLGDFYIGDCECVAVCGSLLMQSNCSGKFANPETFDPARFLDSRKEPTDSKSIVTWGSGGHICPGEKFALMEFRAAIAAITKELNFDIIDMGQIDYFSPSAFAKTQAIIRVTTV